MLNWYVIATKKGPRAIRSERVPSRKIAGPFYNYVSARFWAVFIRESK